MRLRKWDSTGLKQPFWSAMTLLCELIEVADSLKRACYVNMHYVQANGMAESYWVCWRMSTKLSLARASFGKARRQWIERGKTAPHNWRRLRTHNSQLRRPSAVSKANSW